MSLIPKQLRLPRVPDEIRDREDLYSYLKALNKQLTTSYRDIYSSLVVTWGDYGAFRTLADEATPSVKGWNRWVTGGTTTITDFDDGLEGQIIYIISEHTLVITDGTNIFTPTGGDLTLNATDTLTLIKKADGKWHTLSHSDNT